MEILESRLEKGCFVAIRFPFSDLSSAKLRPALILANAGKGDFVLFQITSKAYADANAVVIQAEHFDSGQLPLTSFARPGKLFTAHESLIQKSLGKIKPVKHTEIVDSVYHLLCS
ncbi:hypothetical protein CI610_01108 [invertebrate metagenome]|uniref:Uncharacterized protein n=1 Tax=invertebrate metagenome TaxID=1711999 RepID=A0A2H9T9K7_9ZZZZ